MKKIINAPSNWIDAYSTFSRQGIENLLEWMKNNNIESVGLDGYDDGGDCGQYGRIIAIETRLETDKEYERRLKLEAKQKEIARKFEEAARKNQEKKREAELKELARLKKKYEKPVCSS